MPGPTQEVLFPAESVSVSGAPQKISHQIADSAIISM